MKKLLIVSILIWGYLSAFSQNWVGITGNTPEKAKVKLISSGIDNSVIKFSVAGYNSKNVNTGQQTALTLNVEGSTYILDAGAPDLPKMSASVIIPDKGAMKAEVVSSNYTEYVNVDIAPSKGNLTRDIDPATIPFTYGQAYSEDAFYPGKLAEMRNPYILRDYRGEAVWVYPFQYNPVTKVLRVYSEITVKVSKNGTSGTNELIRTKSLTKVDYEFSKIYGSHFLNYKSSKYTPLEEQGNMLVICYDAFMSAMQPFVDWKNTIGRHTEMVSVTTAGSTDAAIKTYVTNYYNTNGLTYLLLVGDAAQIPPYNAAAGPSDNSYGYILGGDSYPEVFVGRFSAENVSEVQTQVQRTISYELNPSTASGWLNKGVGIGSDLGPGDDNEMDYEHIRDLRTKLMNYQYSAIDELYDGDQGGQDLPGNPDPSMLAADVNAGAGIIAYCGHGGTDQFVTTGFSNSDVDNLTNNNMLPFIWSVACVNGEFITGTCFAEAWLRATYNGQPSGAIATLMSTINQSWDPPMEGEDEMVDILVESYAGNIKRTFGGLSMNGCMKMNDAYGSGGTEMTDTWTIFGDPSLMVRTDTPKVMTVTHPSTTVIGSTQLTINCNVNSAFVCLTINNQIIGTGTVSGGAAIINFSPLTTIDSIKVAVTAYNYIPYIGSVLVINSVQNDATPLAIIEPQNNYNCIGLTVAPELVIENMGTNVLTSLTITCGYDTGTFISQWTGNLVSFQTDTITYPAITLNAGNHTITFTTSLPNGIADQNPSNDVATRNITVNNLPVSCDFTADQTSFCTGPASVNFTNLSTNAISYLWDFGDGSTSTAQNPSHIYNNLGTYTVALIADAGPCGSQTDAETNYITVGAPPPGVTDATLCGPGYATLQATGTGTLGWYDAPTGGNYLGTGNTYITPTLTTTTTYYVHDSLATANQYAGEQNDTTNGSFFTFATSHYLVFDCYAPFTIVSVEVNAGAAGNRTIQLQNSSGAMLQSATINIPAGISRITLNFNVPVGTSFRLAGPVSPNLFRSNTGLSYPYEIPNAISIKYSSATSDPTGYYYFFYDWEIALPACVSAMTPVTAYINSAAPIAAFTYSANGLTVDFTDQTTNPALYLWDFGDGSTSTIANLTHTYASAGTYTVTLIVTNGCGADTVSQQITATALGIADYLNDAVFTIYPNPSNNIGMINYTLPEATNVSLAVYNSVGQKVTDLLNTYQTKGSYSAAIDLSGLRAGVYYCRLIVSGGSSTQKIILTR